MYPVLYNSNSDEFCKGDRAQDPTPKQPNESMERSVEFKSVNSLLGPHHSKTSPDLVTKEIDLLVVDPRRKNPFVSWRMRVSSSSGPGAKLVRKNRTCLFPWETNQVQQLSRVGPRLKSPWGWVLSSDWLSKGRGGSSPNLRLHGRRRTPCTSPPTPWDTHWKEAPEIGSGYGWGHSTWMKLDVVS